MLKNFKSFANGRGFAKNVDGRDGFVTKRDGFAKAARHKLFAKTLFASVLIFALSFGMWLNFAPDREPTARAATSLSAATWVQLYQAMNNSDTDIDITVTADIVITGNLNVPVGKDITIHSADPQNPAVLFRSETMITSNLLNVMSGGTLTLRDIILDGQSDKVTVNNHLIGVSPYLVAGSVNTLNIGDGVILRNNSVSPRGCGAIEVSGAGSTLNMTGGLIIDNQTTSNGGAICIGSSGASANITGGEFRNNSATNGGAISINYDDLANLHVGADVIFANNSASFATTILPSDQESYDAQIAATTWSNGFANGYNNYDIQYPQTFAVRFNGGGNIANQTVLAGDSASEPTAPIRDGYVFAGWFAGADFANGYDFDSAVNADLTLFAKWEKVCETDANLLANDADCQPPCAYNPNLLANDENCVAKEETSDDVPAKTDKPANSDAAKLGAPNTGFLW